MTENDTPRIISLLSYSDSRGTFYESYKHNILDFNIIQENVCISNKNDAKCPLCRFNIFDSYFH